MTKKQLIWMLSAIFLGIAAGTGVFTIHYAKGFSYLSNESSSCANCHIMREHYSAWTRSSHKAVAQCNDCHSPESFIGKYASKASNGFWHSLAFTTGEHPDPIQIKKSNRDITEASCRNCHQLVQHIDQQSANEMQCTRCHAGVGHMTK